MPPTGSPFHAGSLIFALLFTIILSSCATVREAAVAVTPGMELETLQSSVSIRVKSAAGGLAGRGYLVYRRPDRLHLALLAPFGSVLMEVFVAGERITCIVPSKGLAYSGAFADLPQGNLLKGWRLMRWVLAVSAGDCVGCTGDKVRTDADGARETVRFDQQGLLVWKSNGEGDQVSYRDFRLINGVAFPLSMELRNRTGDSVEVVFDEPEVNGAVEAAGLEPALEGLAVLPITDFRGP